MGNSYEDLYSNGGCVTKYKKGYIKTNYKNDYNFKYIKKNLYFVKENAKREYAMNPTDENFNFWVKSIDDYYTFIRIHDIWEEE